MTTILFAAVGLLAVTVFLSNDGYVFICCSGFSSLVLQAFSFAVVGKLALAVYVPNDGDVFTWY